ncbi:MAG: NADH-quinone oxidoreductase subunit N, partial [Acidimicrobiia bacterium]
MTLVPVFDYHALAPELILAATVLGALGLDLVLPEERKFLVASIGVLGLTLAAVPLLTLTLSGTERTLFGDSYVVDSFALVMKGLFVVSGYVVLLLSVGYVEEYRHYQGEYYFLLLSSILGAVVMASARSVA